MNLNTVESFVIDAAKNYLQTVVFVDDQIYNRDGDIPVSKLGRGSFKRRKPAIQEAVDRNQNIKLVTSSIGSDVGNSEQQLSSRDLLNSFAKKRMVCSLYQPEERAAYSKLSDVYQLCLSADVIVLDWVLHGNDGEHTLELVDNIIQQSLEDEPEQLRLIVVYTDKDNLGLVADRLYARLSESISEIEDVQKTSDGLALHTMNSRIIVFGKPNPRRGDHYRDYVKAEKELADAVIQEFAKLADGLLQACVLNGLAEIRKQSRKILTKFYAGLDPAFITHRALKLHDEDAYDHLPSLLVSEIEAVLEDCMPRHAISDTVLRDWCQKWIPTDRAKSFVGREIDAAEFASRFATQGMSISEHYESGKKSSLSKTIKDLGKGNWPSKDSPHFKELSTFLSANDSGADHREFAYLMSHRTHYDGVRKLTLGTVVKSSVGDYFICLQPVCDCVRLDDETSFVFARMDIAKSAKATDVVFDDNEYVELVFKPEAKNCLTIAFLPTQGSVKADERILESISGEKYTWISQMKPKHAQRVAEQFARMLSRVGLTESEWLRLKSK